MYVANIVGCVAGSFLTGFVLLDLLALRDVALVLTILGCSAVAALLMLTRTSSAAFARGMFAVGGMAGAPLVVARPAFDRFYERLLFGRSARELPRFAQVVENRS